MTRQGDLMVRSVIAAVRAGVPIVGVVRYGWSAEAVAFWFWFELVMVGLFFAVVTLREWHGNTPQFALKVPVVLVGYQLPAILAGLCMTAGIRGVGDKLAYVATLFADPAVRTTALVQVGIATAGAVAWNFRAADAEATLDRQWHQMAYRVVAALALGGIALAGVAVWNAVDPPGDWLAGRRYALATSWVVGITWAASELVPRQLARFVDWLVGSNRASTPRYDEP